MTTVNFLSTLTRKMTVATLLTIIFLKEEVFKCNLKGREVDGPTYT